jgi:tetratricopeptide (TPR) repeat protein
MQRADLFVNLNEPLQAARLYEQIWEDNNEQLAALYLSGHAYEKAGRVDEATHHKQLANELALNGRARQTMAAALAERGLVSEAIDQWNIVRSTSPFEHWELNEAARRLAMAQSDQPAVAARHWRHYLLGDLRNVFFMRETESYLRVPTNVHRLEALAAVEAGDLEAADRAIGLAAALTPGDTALGEELTPAFDRAAHSSKGDRLFETLFGRYEADCKKFPNSAFLHNNLAWLAARCGRRLDTAMEHATKAVALQPQNGSYLDTLAEVHFRQGDRESAIRYSRRAVQLSPDRDSLSEQLSRFINDPLPSPLRPNSVDTSAK